MSQIDHGLEPYGGQRFGNIISEVAGLLVERIQALCSESHVEKKKQPFEDIQSVVEYLRREELRAYGEIENETTRRLTKDQLELIMRNINGNAVEREKSHVGNVYTLHLSPTKGFLKEKGARVRMRIEGGAARLTIKIVRDPSDNKGKKVYHKEAFEIHIPINLNGETKITRKVLEGLISRENLGDIYDMVSGMTSHSRYNIKERSSYDIVFEGKNYRIDIDERRGKEPKIDVEGGTKEENMKVISFLLGDHYLDHVAMLEAMIPEIVANNSFLKKTKISRLSGIVVEIFTDLIMSGSNFLDRIPATSSQDHCYGDMRDDKCKSEVVGHYEKEEELIELVRILEETIRETYDKGKRVQVELESETTRLLEKEPFEGVKECLDNGIDRGDRKCGELTDISKVEGDVYTLRIDQPDSAHKKLGIKSRVRIERGHASLTIKLVISKKGNQESGSHKHALEIKFPLTKKIDKLSSGIKRKQEPKLEEVIINQQQGNMSKLFAAIGNFKSLKRKNRVTYSMVYKGIKYTVDFDNKDEPYKIDIEGGTEEENLALYEYILKLYG